MSLVQRLADSLVEILGVQKTCPSLSRAWQEDKPDKDNDEQIDQYLELVCNDASGLT